MRAIFALFIGLLAVGPLPVSAQSYSEPGRWTATRSALMDAIRVHVEWDLGQPTEFVVDQLRVAGDVPYGALSPQLPGGGAIDLYNTPGYRRCMNPDHVDGTHVAVLHRKLRETWVAVHQSIGATDVWFSAPDYCIEYMRRSFRSGVSNGDWCAV
ncbi:hypothetical protein [Roseobacter sp. HKCCD5988]|uniref:hypothetical protein n=1 Tax=Roseobacter sp. HKCCD5988 TaxID=3120338 RepID=UPI0030EE9093